MAVEVEIENVLGVARQVLQRWTQLKNARDQALARDRPAAVGRFFQPIVATHSNLFNACWMATGWRRSDKENRVVVALRQYALSILSRGEYAGELWLDGDDHRRWVHAHVERLAGEQVHKTDWSRQAQRILDSGATLDAVERAVLTGCLSARAITPGVQALLDAIGARCIPDSRMAEVEADRIEESVKGISGAPHESADSDSAAKGGPDADGSPALERLRAAKAEQVELDLKERKAALVEPHEPASEPARRRG